MAVAAATRMKVLRPNRLIISTCRQEAARSPAYLSIYFCLHGAASQHRITIAGGPASSVGMKRDSILAATTSIVPTGTAGSQLSGRRGLQGYQHIDQQVGRLNNVVLCTPSMALVI